jgi:orotate phosphoribosyltransferase
MDLGALLDSTGAILRGHFLLTSGRHSDVYFEKFRVLERPNAVVALCGQIAVHFKDSGVTHVAGPTTGGIILAFEVARQMGVHAIYVESVDGKKTLRRNAEVPDGAKILVVDDVFTTGRSVVEVLELLATYPSATVVGAASLIDRAQAPVELGVPYFTAYKVEATSYAPDQIPDWLAKIPITKPGTRTTTHEAPL